MVKWHSLKRFDETTLRYALQQGFVCNGYAAYNTAEFQWLLKNYFHYFFFDDNAVHNRDEANYWLKNYLSSSLGQAVMDYLQSESYSDKEFIEMLGYVLGRYDETGTGIYELVEKLLPYIQNRKGLLNAIAEIHQLSIENYWTKTRGTTAVLFPECLKEYLSFVVRNLNSYPELFTQLTSRLDSSIRTNIRKDLEKITADEAQTESYRADLGKLVDKAQQMNLDLPYIGRYNNEQIFVNKQKQAIRQKNEKEKQEKLAFTKSEFDKIVKKQRDIYKSQTTTDKFKQSFYLNIAFSLTGIVFLLALFFINANRPVTIISLAAIALTGFLGHRIGNNLAVSLTRSRYDENIGGAIAGMYAGMIAGIYFRGYIPAIHELAGFRVDWTLPIEILMLLVFLILAIFGGRAYFFIRKNNKAVNAIQLPAREQEALDENQKEIDRYYKEKETFENFQETARIITLNDRQFDMEFAKLK